MRPVALLPRRGSTDRNSGEPGKPLLKTNAGGGWFHRCGRRGAVIKLSSLEISEPRCRVFAKGTSSSARHSLELCAAVPELPVYNSATHIRICRFATGACPSAPLACSRNSRSCAVTMSGAGGTRCHNRAWSRSSLGVAGSFHWAGRLASLRPFRRRSRFPTRSPRRAGARAAAPPRPRGLPPPAHRGWPDARGRTG
jgi:hypothetical protein